MKRRWRAIILSACCSSNICALQHHHDPPEAPRPKVIDRQFLAVYGALSTAKTLDMMSTVHSLAAGAREQNPLFGSHPSTGRLVGLNLAYLGGELVMGYELKKFGMRHRWARYLWMIEPGFQTTDHIRCVHHNYRGPF